MIKYHLTFFMVYNDKYIIRWGDCVEVWDIYDEDRKLTGRTMKKGEPFKEGDYHLVVHVCIFNDRDEMLIQKRQKDKESNPDMWDLSVAGSSIKGETSREAGEREVLEEIGYRIDLSEERPFFTINYQYGFDDFYLVERDLDLDELTIQEEEVQDLRWASREEVLRLREEGSFIDYYFLDILFDMRKQRGSYRLGGQDDR